MKNRSLLLPLLRHSQPSATMRHPEEHCFSPIFIPLCRASVFDAIGNYILLCRVNSAATRRAAPHLTDVTGLLDCAAIDYEKLSVYAMLSTAQKIEHVLTILLESVVLCYNNITRTSRLVLHQPLHERVALQYYTNESPCVTSTLHKPVASCCISITRTSRLALHQHYTNQSPRVTTTLHEPVTSCYINITQTRPSLIVLQQHYTNQSPRVTSILYEPVATRSNCADR